MPRPDESQVGMMQPLLLSADIQLAILASLPEDIARVKHALAEANLGGLTGVTLLIVYENDHDCAKAYAPASDAAQRGDDDVTEAKRQGSLYMVRLIDFRFESTPSGKSQLDLAQFDSIRTALKAYLEPFRTRIEEDIAVAVL